LGFSSVRLLVNTPSPYPSAVLESLTSGFFVVLQHIPLTRISELPSLVTSPPPMALDGAISVTGAVVSFGGLNITHPGMKSVRKHIIRNIWNSYPFFIVKDYVNNRNQKLFAFFISLISIIKILKFPYSKPKFSNFDKTESLS